MYIHTYIYLILYISSIACRCAYIVIYLHACAFINEYIHAHANVLTVHIHVPNTSINP